MSEYLPPHQLFEDCFNALHSEWHLRCNSDTSCGLLNVLLHLANKNGIKKKFRARGKPREGLQLHLQQKLLQYLHSNIFGSRAHTNHYTVARLLCEDLCKPRTLKIQAPTDWPRFRGRNSNPSSAPTNTIGRS
jgi:hypothetical protein